MWLCPELVMTSTLCHLPGAQDEWLLGGQGVDLTSENLVQAFSWGFGKKKERQVGLAEVPEPLHVTRVPECVPRARGGQWTDLAQKTAEKRCYAVGFLLASLVS